jgi:hypothetical protein
MSTDTDVSAETLDLVRTVCPKIRDNGWLYFFSPVSDRRASDLGLDIFTFYFVGRGGPLGDVEWPVVHAAFGYFNPAVIKDSWERGREKMAPRDAGRAFIECGAEFGREKLSAVEGLDEFCAAADAVNEAARGRAESLPLYAAWSAEQLADDPPARAMQLVSTLREFRGSAHLLAVVASGLRPIEAHFIFRPEMFGIFGWADSDKPEVGDEHRQRLDAAGDLTDRLVAPAYGVLDEAGAKALSSGMDAIEAALAS